MRKKLFAILMSAMMMVTFMPSMAFANGVDDKITGQTVEDPSKLDVACDNTKHATHCAAVGLSVKTETITAGGYKFTKSTCPLCGDSWLSAGTAVTHTHKYVTKNMTYAEYKALVTKTVPNWLKDFATGKYDIEDT